METTFHLNADELNASFLEGLRKLFAGQDIVISVAPELDATTYLLSNGTRKAQLLQSIGEAESGERMAYVKEPQGEDFIIQSEPLTETARQEISEFIRDYKARAAHSLKQPKLTRATRKIAARS